MSDPHEEPRPNARRAWRKFDIAAVVLGIVAVAALGVAVYAWAAAPPSAEECQEQVDVMTEDRTVAPEEELTEKCLERFDNGELEMD